ncbi:ribosome rescue GTPase HflX [Rehaibacterium terrae]|uniref:GTPase HflX n=1 Tax=Rehaibacterium terrae TaxID=1341696 RepID=A0A7W7Y020_9GAMM|nr:GTP-binding protein HflX [Rehaibacterium terrae]
MFERSKRGEHALLIQPLPPARGGGSPDDDPLEEFAELARSAGATIAATLTARIDRPNPGYYLGSGKVEEARMLCDTTGADLVLVNHQLSPVQVRNLERALQRRVIDRTGLILDIFALRARSHEGKLQVELAQLKHLATRLVRGWTHLERQRGGAIGLRGPGETQLEMDRRLLQRRVESLQRQLDKVEVQRAQMRRARLRNEVPRVALVGYTNAGKSTLFNALTGAGVYAADQLFATLDPTVRRVEGLDCGPLVLSDTVGFVRDLPHELVAAFRSTLSEARDADLLLHVIDAADPLRDERIAQVDAVLEEIGAGELPQLLVYNKIDRIEGAAPRRDHPGQGHERVWLSAMSGQGLELLRQALAERFAVVRLRAGLHLPGSAGRLRARLYELGAVRGERVEDDGWRLDLDMPRSTAEQLAVLPEAAPLKALLLAAHGGGSYNRGG